MTGFDVVLLAVWLLAAIDGYRRGFIVHMADLLILVPAVLVTVHTWQDVADSLVLSHGVAPITARLAAPLAIFLVIQGAGSLALFLLNRKIPEAARTSPLNRYGGIPPALLKTTVGACVLLLIASAVPAPALQELMKGSSLTPAAVRAGRTVTAWFGLSVEETVGRAVRQHTIPRTGHGSERIKIPAITADSKLRVEPATEQEMLTLLNRERARAGVGLLTLDVRLREVARAHSLDMWHRGYFAHQDPDGRDAADRVVKERIPFELVGENLALAPSLQMAHDGLMQSPGHRANILERRYKRVGIGIILGGSQGLMVTQVFSN